MWEVVFPLVSIPAQISYVALLFLWRSKHLHTWVKVAASLLLVGRISLGVATSVTLESIHLYERVIAALAVHSTLDSVMLLMLVALSLVPRRTPCP